MASVLVGAAAVMAPVAITAPAQAAPVPHLVRPMASHDQIGSKGTDPRCSATTWKVCLFAGPSTGTGYAYWHTNSAQKSLANYYFAQGTGTNQNTNVQNWAQAISCTNDAVSCTVWSGATYTGNSDAIANASVGILNYTSKHAASLSVS
ncbi:hypothetical protein [Actinacidiphila paucisporea]|nr:hypothetical protein [Actinacidiphila paucisporea]